MGLFIVQFLLEYFIVLINTNHICMVYNRYLGIIKHDRSVSKGIIVILLAIEKKQIPTLVILKNM